MKVPVKASPEAIVFASKLSKTKLPKSTKWEQVFEIIFEGFVVDMYTHCASSKEGPVTVIKVFSEVTDELVHTFKVSNEDYFVESEGDWNFPAFYKLMCEWMIQERKNLTKKKSVSKKSTKNK